MKLPDKLTESAEQNNSHSRVVLWSRLMFRMSLTLLHIIREELGRGTGCVLWVFPCRRRGGGSRSVAGGFGNIIRIQHTACKMQQMGSSLEWQLWVSCHTQLQLACQSKAAPRSFLYLHPSTYSTFSVFFLLFFLLPSFIWPRLMSFRPVFPHSASASFPSILPPQCPCRHLHMTSQAEILVVC